MGDQNWKSLDTTAAIRKQREKREDATTTANVGVYAVPLGPVMVRGGIPAPKTKTAKKK